MSQQLTYSNKYYDDRFEYRVIMTNNKIDNDHLLTEKEVSDLGIAQSPGWVHVYTHSGHLLLFKRRRGNG